MVGSGSALYSSVLIWTRIIFSGSMLRCLVCKRISYLRTCVSFLESDERNLIISSTSALVIRIDGFINIPLISDHSFGYRLTCWMMVESPLIAVKGFEGYSDSLHLRQRWNPHSAHEFIGISIFPLCGAVIVWWQSEHSWDSYLACKIWWLVQQSSGMTFFCSYTIVVGLFLEREEISESVGLDISELYELSELVEL